MSVEAHLSACWAELVGDAFLLVNVISIALYAFAALKRRAGRRTEKTVLWTVFGVWETSERFRVELVEVVALVAVGLIL